MCGIAGILRFDGQSVDPEVIRAMCDSLIHRGPDGEGYEFPVPYLGLGHRRLSIIDIEGGRQPLSNEDDSVWITFNGEIFNFPELRKELIAKGHTFKTSTDTEVIVHLFEEEGPDCVKRLNGQFAFALWNGKQLFCARDAMGIKPLYYLHANDRFAFASEPRALMQMPDWQPEIDLDGIELFFRYRFIPAPVTGLRGVRKLLPGEWLLVDRDGELKRKRFFEFDPARSETLHDVPAATERLRRELTESVDRQLISDVPVGAFLSGGMDSSTTAALMAQQSPNKIYSFSIGFEEPKYDETRWAKAVAEKSGTDHTVEVFSADNARGVIHDVLGHFDEPFGDTSILPTFFLCRLARRKVKVALSGDGGDELFAGYGRFFRALHLLAIPPFLRPLYPLIRKLQDAPRDPASWKYADTHEIEKLYHSILTRIDTGQLRQLFGERMRNRDRSDFEDPILGVLDRARPLPPLSRVLAIDVQSILSEYHLVKMDRASMQNSLEVRVPILDQEFVKFCFELSAPVKLHGNLSKGILREGMRDLLPKSVLNRRKKGFSVPFKYWFADSLSDLARDRLSNAEVVSQGLLSQTAIDGLLTPKRGKTDGSRLWRVLVLETWLRSLKDRCPPRPPPGSPGALARG